MPINILESAKNDDEKSFFFYNLTVGDDILNHEYNSREGAIDGARAMVREVCRVFNIPFPDMSGHEWYKDSTRDDRLKENR